MLSTINGFDLLLTITIVVLAFKVYNLNRECESYVGQIIEVSQDNYRLSEQIHDLKYPAPKPAFDKGIYADVCNYCLGISGFECTCEPDKCIICSRNLIGLEKKTCDKCINSKPQEIYPPF